MDQSFRRLTAAFALGAAAAGLALVPTTGTATPITYQVDPKHTHPEFEAEHMNGLSIWRGIFKSTTGTITLDREAQTGTVDITTEVGSVEFGNDELDKRSRAADFFDTDQYPTAHYQGTLVDWVNGTPTAIHGQFTLKGQTHPLDLKIDRFKCLQEPAPKKDVCGADATGTFDRFDWGVDQGKAAGLSGAVTLHIQVEAFDARK